MEENIALWRGPDTDAMITLKSWYRVAGWMEGDLVHSSEVFTLMVQRIRKKEGAAEKLRQYHGKLDYQEDGGTLPDWLVSQGVLSKRVFNNVTSYRMASPLMNVITIPAMPHVYKWQPGFSASPPIDMVELLSSPSIC